VQHAPRPSGQIHESLQDIIVGPVGRQESAISELNTIGARVVHVAGCEKQGPTT